MSDWVVDLVEELTKLGCECAEAEAATKLLEDNRKSVLAKIKLKFSHINSDAGRETEARASDEFFEFNNTLSVARERSTIMRVRYNAQDMLCRLRQTQASLKKSEINAQMAHHA
mgnify:CR=1 FL=1